MAEVIERLGGVCRWGELRRAVSWRLIGPAVEDGSIVRQGGGVYALPATDEGRSLAVRMTGVLSHRSAALHWGWKVKTPPDRPDVTIPANRKRAKRTRDLATLHWRTLGDGDKVDGWVTTQVRTVVDCCLDLPFDEALAVFDSALRDGVKRRQVIEATLGLGKIQRARVLTLARVASSGAANPFESVLRALAIQAGGTGFEPQHRIRYDDFYARVDVGDGDLQIVLEAESFEFHGGKVALKRDCVRYTELAARGWYVLRFTWEQVMFQQDWVRRMIGMTVERRRAERAREGRVPDEPGRPTGPVRVVAAG